MPDPKRKSGSKPRKRRSPPKKRMNRETAAAMDEAIRHAVDLEALKNFMAGNAVLEFEEGVAAALIRKAEKSLDRIRNRGRFSPVQDQENVKALLAANREIIRAGLKSIETRLKKELGKVSVMEAEATLKQIQSAYPVGVSLKSPSPAVLRAAVEKSPVRGDFVPKWFKTLEDKTASAVEREIRIGLAEGKSTPEITRALRGRRDLKYSDGVLTKPRREIETLVRTSVQNVVTDAREQTYRENGDIVIGVRLIAVLDSRTTFICISEDQQVYPIGSGPRPPLHFNCRTMTIPELKSAEELGFKYTPSVGTRAALGAEGGERVAANLTYSDWFARQPVSWQKEVLGPGRYDLYRRGVPLSSMGTDSGRRLSLEAIRQRAGLN